jgi:general secretion pathway protein D
VAYARSNLVVITDTAANAARLRELVTTFDSDTFGELNAKVYKIEHAALDEISQELWTVLESYQVVESGARVHMIPLARLNALAVIALDPVVFANIEYWLDILDVEAEGGARRQVYVYRVENSKAADLANVLNDLYAGEGQSKGDRRSRSGALAEEGVGLGGGASTARSRSSGSRSGQQRGGQTTRPRSSAGRTASVPLTPGALFEHEIKIVPDEITNSLVILATPRDYNMIRSVLLDLDVVPRQVLIEVLIAEITLDEDTQFGITQELLAVSTDDSDSTATLQDAGGTFLDIFGRDVRFTGGLPSADSSFGGFMGVFTHFRSGAEVYRGILKAMAVRSRVKVLSRPHIMASNNQEASIIVGQEVPIITSQANTNVETSGQTRFLQNVQYRNTGVILKVKPQVNSEGLVNMKISQEVSDIIGTTTGDISSPTFSKREADTTVAVQAGETIVIGGIIGETLRKGTRGVPYLMDLPVLGRLFRSKIDQIDRTELVVLITPYVVRDRDEARSVTEEFRRKVDDVLRELKDEGRLIEEGHTVILERSES